MLLQLAVAQHHFVVTCYRLTILQVYDLQLQLAVNMYWISLPTQFISLLSWNKLELLKNLLFTSFR